MENIPSSTHLCRLWPYKESTWLLRLRSEPMALRAVDPGVTCCFMTGDTSRYSEDELRRRGAKHLLKKPFRLEEVEQVLRRWAFPDPVPG